MNTDEVLDYAIEMRDVAQETDYTLFDWRTPLRVLVQSGVFTTPQAARILRMSKQYAQRHIKSLEGPASADKRSRSGVAGHLDPADLDKIKLLRAMWSVREADMVDGRQRYRSISEAERELIEDIVNNEENGVRTLSHLTGVPVQTLYRVRREGAES